MTPRQERNVERAIRLWIAQQERSQRKSRQSGGFKVHADTPGVRRQSPGAPPTR
jgi:hypothetical protein